MANINQPAPGTPESAASEVTLVQEDWSTETGVVVHRQLFSDGSRRNVVNGVVEEVRVLSDVEKAAETAVTNVDDAEAAALAEADAIAEKLAQATEEERAAVEAELARVEELAAETEAKVAAEVEVEEPKVESVVHQVEEKAAKVWESIEGFEFKTIQELKDLAAEHGINLHGATKKDDIVDNFKQEDKHES